MIRETIDIHYHIGPEIIPRKLSTRELIEKESGRIRGLVLKNHFYPTTPFIKDAEKKKGKLQLFGSVVLNNSVGGVNAEAVYGTSLLAANPFFVWFPTINAKNFLMQSRYEIAPEWVADSSFKGRRVERVTPAVLSYAKIRKTLMMIKEKKAILATGHISWKESISLINLASEIGLKKIVVTHPIYQRINMPIQIQKKLAKKGCFIEQCYSMYSIDKISVKKIVRQIREVGVQSVIMSSDTGQFFSPFPSDALFDFAQKLSRLGFTEYELECMLVRNPKNLLTLD